MNYHDFKKHLTNFTICYVNDAYKYNSFRSKCAYRQRMYYQMQINKDGQYYVSVCQTSKRKFQEKEGYQYSQVHIVVGRDKGNGKYEYIKSESDARQEVYVDLKNIRRGTYVVHVSIDWYQKNTRNFVISSYGAGDAKFSETNINDSFLSAVYCDRAKSNPQKKSLQDKGLPNSYTVSTFDDAYPYYYLNNL